VDPKRVYYLLRNFVLNTEDVLEVTIIALGPNMAVGISVNELCRYSDALTRSAQAALKHVTDAKIFAYLRQIRIFFLAGKGSVAGNDEEARYLGEVGDDVLGNAIAKILLFWIAAHIGEG
jgi:hypothetical protein